MHPNGIPPSGLNLDDILSLVRKIAYRMQQNLVHIDKEEDDDEEVDEIIKGETLESPIPQIVASLSPFETSPIQKILCPTSSIPHSSLPTTTFLTT